jgi:hypothetical protein
MARKIKAQKVSAVESTLNNLELKPLVWSRANGLRCIRILVGVLLNKTTLNQGKLVPQSKDDIVDGFVKMGRAARGKWVDGNKKLLKSLKVPASVYDSIRSV